MNPLNQYSSFYLIGNSNVKEFSKQTEQAVVMHTVRRRRLVRTNELTCIISYIFSARRKPGEVIAPMLTCSIMPLTATPPRYAAYIEGLQECGASPPPGPPQCPSSRSHRLSPSDIQYAVAEQGTCVQELTPGKQCPKAICTSGEIRPPRHPHCPNTPLINISLEAMARQGSKESPFTYNCY